MTTQTDPAADHRELFAALRETAPDQVRERVAGATESGEPVWIQLASDMATADLFAECWLVVTDRRLLLVQANGHDAPVQAFALSEMRTARVVPLVGGGRLEVERHDGPPAHLYYSASLAPKFAEAAESLKQLATGRHVGWHTGTHG